MDPFHPEADQEARGASRRAKRRRISGPRATGTRRAEEVAVVIEPPPPPPAPAAAAAPAELIDLSNDSDDDDDEPVVVGTRPAPPGQAGPARRPLPRGYVLLSLRERLRYAAAPSRVASSAPRPTAAAAQGSRGSAQELIDLLMSTRGPSVVHRHLPPAPPGGGLGRRFSLRSLPGDPVPFLFLLGGTEPFDLLSRIEELSRLGGNRGASDEMINGIPTYVMGDSKKRSREEDEPCCSICLEDMEPGNTISTLPCKHEFHTSCVNRWLKEQKVCALCKHPIDQPRRAS